MPISVAARRPFPVVLPALSPTGIALCMALFALGLRLLLLPGFGGTDDVVYALRGSEIAHGVWRASTYVGDLRYGINLPIALFATLFGGSTLALTGWSLLSSVVEVGLVAWFGAVAWGRGAGLAAGFVLAVTPMHIVLGGRALADAPLAMFVTLAFVAFASAERTGRRAAWLVAGLACGACWWIKPVAAVPLYLAMAAYVAVARRLDARWLITVLGCAAMIVAELVFLAVVSGDPLSTLKAHLPLLDSHQPYGGEVWGSRSPWFYFQRMFLDGRDMWLVPFVALGGAAVLARRLTATRRQAGDTAAADRFVQFWAATMIGTFSFFVMSLNPVRFIPKQDNYALIFVAPLALLAAAALMRLPVAARGAVMVALAAGGPVLAGLEQQAHRHKYSRLAQAVALAQSRAHAVVVVSGQTVSVARLRELTGLDAHVPTGLEPFSAFDRFTGAGALREGKPLVMVLEPSSPERLNNALWPQIERLAQCAQPLRELPAESSGAGTAAVGLVGWLRPRLPAVVGRQLGFAVPVIDPPAAQVLAVPEACRMSRRHDRAR